MVKLTTYGLRLIERKRGIKNYWNISRETLLSSFDELERNFKTLSEKGLERIAKMQNKSQGELEQIAEIRRIKNYEKMSKGGLIIALLKSKRSLAELFKNNFDNDRIRWIKKILNELRDSLTKEYRKKIKKSFTK